MSRDATIVMPRKAEERVDEARERIEALFERTHQRLFRLALRLGLDEEAARDAVQETFLRGLRHAKRVPEGEDAAASWAVRVLVNLTRDHERRRRVREAHRAGQIRAPQRAHDEAVVARRAVWGTLRTLPPRQRACVVLHELEGHAVGDVARLLGVTSVTVRWHLAAARRALRRALVAEEDR